MLVDYFYTQSQTPEFIMNCWSIMLDLILSIFYSVTIEDINKLLNNQIIDEDENIIANVTIYDSAEKVD